MHEGRIETTHPAPRRTDDDPLGDSAFGDSALGYGALGSCSPWQARAPRRVLLAAGLLVLLLAGPLVLALGTATPVLAAGGASRGGAAAPPAEGDRAEALRSGAALFDQCIVWLSKDGKGVGVAKDFYVRLEAELALDRSQHTGPMRLWWAGNGRFRQELSTQGRTVTKILNIDKPGTDQELARMWVIEGSGRVRRQHGRPDGLKAIPQLREDAMRLGDLAQFITLRQLKRPKATFHFDGLTTGKGTYSGTWARVTREEPGQPKMTFWFAYTKNADGLIRATWPGIVRVEGNAKEGFPTEDYILRDWQESGPEQKPPFRFPRLIEAYSKPAGSQERPVRFLKATVKDIKINGGIDPARFLPPSRRR